MKKSSKKQSKIKQLQTKRSEYFDSCLRQKLIENSIFTAPDIRKGKSEDGDDETTAIIDMGDYNALIRFVQSDGCGIMELKFTFSGVEGEFDVSNVFALFDVFDSELYLFIDCDTNEGIENAVSTIVEALNSYNVELKNLVSSGKVSMLVSPVNDEPDILFHDIKKISKAIEKYKTKATPRTRSRLITALESGEEKGILDISEKIMLKKLSNGEEVTFKPDQSDRDKMYIRERRNLSLKFFAVSLVVTGLLCGACYFFQARDSAVVPFGIGRLVLAVLSVAFLTVAFDFGVSRIVFKRRFEAQKIKLSKEVTDGKGSVLDVWAEKILIPVVFAAVFVVLILGSVSSVTISKSGVIEYTGFVKHEIPYSEITDVRRIVGVSYDDKVEMYDHPDYLFIDSQGEEHRFTAGENKEENLKIEQILADNHFAVKDEIEKDE